MPFQKLTLRPGINTQFTQTLNEGGWSSGSLVRFREGIPQTIGGWTPFSQVPLQGACRALHAWVTLVGIDCLGAGTNQRLYIAQGAQPFDITPIVRSVTPTNPFATTSGSAIVTVSDTGNGQAAGNYVEISGGSAVNGILLAGEYTIDSIIDANTYRIVAGNNASGTGAGGGTPTLAYLLAPGAVDDQPEIGYGVGNYGAGTYGTPRASGAGAFLPRLWTLDNWGEQFIACARDAGIYVWLPASGVAVRASAVTNAPLFSKGALVAMPQQMLIAFGCSPPSGGTQDPMLVAWSDVADYNNWTPASTNQAGSFRLSDGSQIMAALRAQGQILIWTDTAIVAMQYIQPPFVWGFTQLANGCGLISPNAAAVLGPYAYWMAGLNFWRFDGTAHPIDCPVRDAIYSNMNIQQSGKIFAAVNAQWAEVTWFYPSAASIEIDSYVTLNTQDGTWSTGLLSRTAWIDTNVFGNPIATDASGNIWNHESGTDAGASPLAWFIESGIIDIAQGEQFAFVDLLLPDQVITGSGPVGVTLYQSRFPGDVPTAYGPFMVMPATESIPVRVRGRQLAIRFGNDFNALGSSWRLGAVRVRIAPDGRN